MRRAPNEGRVPRCERSTTCRAVQQAEGPLQPAVREDHTDPGRSSCNGVRRRKARLRSIHEWRGREAMKGIKITSQHCKSTIIEKNKNLKKKKKKDYVPITDSTPEPPREHAGRQISKPHSESSESKPLKRNLGICILSAPLAPPNSGNGRLVLQSTWHKMG